MGRWRKRLTRDRLYLAGLFAAALLLYLTNLGDLPLRDWDEGIVAGVARNIWRASPESYTWLFPTINYDDPYWNKPPLIHWSIALAYRLFGVSEWSTRIFPAFLSACTVPLLYLIGREVFATYLPALFSALVYLTLLPVARHGRVAMLDGAIACWFCLAVWCLLRGRQEREFLWGTGIAIGLICLTKGIMMGVLLAGITVIFLAWDSHKILTKLYFWGSLLIGILPAIAWYALQYWHYGGQFIGISLGTQTFNRIWEPVSSAAHPPWYYLLEIAKYSLPWLIFLPSGVKLALRQSHHSWSKLALTWSGVYLLAVSLMATKLPWYIIPLYPGLSLLIGAGLGEIWHKNHTGYFVKIFLSLLAGGGCLGTIYYSSLSATSDTNLASILLVVAVSFSIASISAWRRSRYFIPVIIAGFYLALWLLFNSPLWLWELNEAFPVQPLARILQQHTPPRQQIYTAYPNLRPALEFYSDRVIVPASDEQLIQLWQTEPAYLLVNSKAIDRLNLKPHRKLGKYSNSKEWHLITQTEGAFSQQ